MRNYKTQSIIIHKRPVFEKDYAVTLFTPLYGKIYAYAKGARQLKSKFTGHLNLLNVCDIELYDGPKKSIITECQLKKSYTHFQEDLKKFYVSENIAKMIKEFSTENENHEDLYSLLLETFEALDIYNKENLIFEAFKIKLFSLLGTLPNVYALNNTEFANLDIRIKKLILFLHEKSYKEIMRLYLNKQDTMSLKKMTTELLAYTV